MECKLKRSVIFRKLELVAKVRKNLLPDVDAECGPWNVVTSSPPSRVPRENHFVPP